MHDAWACRSGDVFDTLQIYLGSLYVNDFNLFGRTWQVIVQADAEFRNQVEDVKRLKVRNNARATWCRWARWPTSAKINGPLILTRYNMYPAAAINGSTGPGVSSGQGIDVMEQLADRELPPSMAFEWTEMAYLRAAGGQHGHDDLRAWPW